VTEAQATRSAGSIRDLAASLSYALDGEQKLIGRRWRQARRAVKSCSSVLPAAVPSILTGCRIGLVISCIVVFLAEMITSTDGLGHLLVTAARTFQAVDMFVPLITISLLGLILNGLLQALRSFLLRGFGSLMQRLKWR